MESKATVLRPVLPAHSHPISTGHYVVPTKVIDTMCQKAVSWVHNRTTGAIIYGRPRLGKSKAIEYLSDVLRQEFGAQLPVYSVNCPSFQYPKETAFFEHLLKKVGHQLVHKGTMSMKRSRLTNFLADAGHTTNRIVILLDDAQNLQSPEYNWLMDVFNEVMQMGINVTAILVGQNELLGMRKSLQLEGKQQIIGRFMVQSHKFEGVKSGSDIATCLLGYDRVEHPVGSGWSFTRYFFPEAYATGFRLESHAESLHTVFRNLSLKTGHKHMEIPMHYLIASIEYVLREYGADGRGLNDITPKLWERSVIQSGYVEAETLTE